MKKDSVFILEFMPSMPSGTTAFLFRFCSRAVILALLTLHYLIECLDSTFGLLFKESKTKIFIVPQ